MKYTVLIVIVALALSSCKKPDEFPVVPAIVYKSIFATQNAQGYDSKLTVLLNFTDGDGDIGYKDAGLNDSIFDDPNSQYYNNYVAKIFKLQNSVWVAYPTILPLGGRLPYLTPEGSNKSIKGEIACDFDVPLQATNDTFRLDVFIYDRALHQSNTIQTDAIVLNTQ
jgi:hypothetical protein